ncbi:MAG: rod shape-determining protein MreC [bacterium]
MKIVIILSAIILIFIFCYFQGYLNFFYSVLQYPLKLVYFTSQKISDLFQTIAFIGELHRENNALFEQNQRLFGLNASSKEVQRENDFLRQQLNLDSQQGFKLAMASVVSSGQSFFIDQQIENKPVILPGGILIGKTENNGLVKLITDPQSKINVMIQETRAQGVVRGDYGLGLIMDLPISEAMPEKGQLVITSGQNQEFPSGLLIGQIIDVSKNDNQISQKIRIQPLFNPRDLEKVFVITLF